MSYKIIDLPALGRPFNVTDIIEVSADGTGSYKANIGNFTLGGTNYLFVNANGTPIENGNALINAYNYAVTLSPNGLARSANNRIVLLLAPGYYDFDELNNGGPFTIITSFIDFQSLSGSRDVYFSSIDAKPMTDDGLDIRFSGIDTTVIGYYPHRAFAIASTGGVNEHIVAINCKGGDYSFSAFSNAFVGRYENCEASSYSFLSIPSYTPPEGVSGFLTGVDVTNYGQITNCTAVNSSFCSNSVTDITGGSASNWGDIYNCTANDHSFVTAANSVFNYTPLRNCKARIYSFCVKYDPNSLFSGYSINQSTIENCYAIVSSICYAYKPDVLSGSYFDAQNNGIITKCTLEGTDGICMSYYGGVNYGKIMYCYAYSNSFCGPNNGYNSGYIVDCIANDNAFISYAMSHNTGGILRCTLLYDDFTVSATTGWYVLCIGGSNIVNS